MYLHTYRYTNNTLPFWTFCLKYNYFFSFFILLFFLFLIFFLFIFLLVFYCKIFSLLLSTRLSGKRLLYFVCGRKRFGSFIIVLFYFISIKTLSTYIIFIRTHTHAQACWGLCGNFFGTVYLFKSIVNLICLYIVYTLDFISF
jgi:hypothetical protein